MKIQFRHTISSSFQYVWRNKNDMLLLGWPLTIFMSIILLFLRDFLVNFYSSMAENPDTSLLEDFDFNSTQPILVFLLLIIFNIIPIMFMQTWIRKCILAESIKVYEVFQPKASHIKIFFFVTSVIFCTVMVTTILFVLIYLMTFGQNAAGSGNAGIYFLIFSLVITAWVLARLAPIVVSLGLERQMGLAECWNMTRGNSLRIFGLMVLPSIVVGLVWFIPGAIMHFILSMLPWPKTGFFIGALADNFISLAGLAVTATALAMAYRTLHPGAGHRQV